MKNTEDLIAAVTRMHAQYSASRIDRDIVCGWVLGLPSYPASMGSALDAAKAWFRQKQEDITEDVRRDDLAHLMAVVMA